LSSRTKSTYLLPHHQHTEYPTPRLICPPNQLLELPANGGDKVEIALQKPKTDVNFKRDVAIKPSWIKGEDKITLGLGVLNVSYIARHPVSKLTVACTTTLFVVGECMAETAVCGVGV
jgi:hypothetical protein